MAYSEHERAKHRPHPIVMQLAILAEMQRRTQQELTEADGISIEAWRSWIKGRRSPSLDLLAKRAETLGQKLMLCSLKAGLDKPN